MTQQTIAACGIARTPAHSRLPKSVMTMCKDTGGQSRRMSRVLLDSNVWRYVVDAGAQGRLLRAAGNWSHSIQIAPAVVYEALRLRDVPLRNRLVALMTNRRFERLMPEAYSEAMEILAE